MSPSMFIIFIFQVDICEVRVFQNFQFLIVNKSLDIN
jgi:hypothetical protein